MSDAPKKPRTRKPMTAGAGIDKVHAIRETRAARRAALLENFDNTERVEEGEIRDRIDPAAVQLFDHMAKSLPTGTEEPMFGDEPGDTDRYLALCNVIDDEIGWETRELEEGGDYEARLRRLGAQRLRLAKLWADVTDARAIPDALVELLVEIRNEVENPSADDDTSENPVQLAREQRERTEGRPAFLDDPAPPLRPGERTEVDRSAKGGR